jgi:hypothetical protein
VYRLARSTAVQLLYASASVVPFAARAFARAVIAFGAPAAPCAKTSFTNDVP